MLHSWKTFSTDDGIDEEQAEFANGKSLYSRPERLIEERFKLIYPKNFSNDRSLIWKTASYMAQTIKTFEANNFHQLQILPQNLRNLLFYFLVKTRQPGESFVKLMTPLIHRNTKWIKIPRRCELEMNDEMLGLFSICTSLDTIGFGYTDAVTKQGLINFFTGKKKLRVIYATNCYEMDDDVMKCIVENCPLLSCLYIGNAMRASYCRITDSGIGELVKLRHLKILSVLESQVTDDGFNTVFQGCRKSLLAITFDRKWETTIWMQPKIK